ncbi:MAG: glucose-1-phosphate adenylyltransferase subunit GlgD [Tissierellia bacterium]|nr:glucose-1-phosphate adenylyltransferase subunit GlgD [Tissierellia bacterium]
MKKTLGILAPIFEDNSFGALTNSRESSMLPFGCRYRLIDFPLSNMTHYDIRTVAIYSGKKIRSHMDHLNMGAPWNLNRRFQGLFLFPPVATDDERNKYGEMVDFDKTETFFRETREKYVYYHRPRFLMKPDLDAMFQHFEETGADVCLLYAPCEDPMGRYAGLQQLYFDEEGRFDNLGYHLGTSPKVNLYLNSFLMKKEIFVDLARRSLERGDVSTMEDALYNYRDELNIVGFRHDGFFEAIRDIPSFYRANMCLLEPDFYRQIFGDGHRILTKTKDEPSTFYTKTAHVSNSLFANGCQISGRVENSLVFRGAHIEEGAHVKNSIIMQKAHIKKGAVVINAILDKYVTVGEGQYLMGSQIQPYVLPKNSTIEEVL